MNIPWPVSCLCTVASCLRVKTFLIPPLSLTISGTVTAALSLNLLTLGLQIIYNRTASSQEKINKMPRNHTNVPPSKHILVTNIYWSWSCVHSHSPRAHNRAHILHYNATNIYWVCSEKEEWVPEIRPKLMRGPAAGPMGRRTSLPCYSSLNVV